jgi:TolA-binding protein
VFFLLCYLFISGKLVAQWTVDDVGLWLTTARRGVFKTLYPVSGLDGATLAAMTEGDFEKLGAEGLFCYDVLQDLVRNEVIEAETAAYEAATAACIVEIEVMEAETAARAARAAADRVERLHGLQELQAEIEVKRAKKEAESDRRIAEKEAELNQIKAAAAAAAAAAAERLAELDGIIAEKEAETAAAMKIIVQRDKGTEGSG